ncbi:MAG: hypothetical protein C0505_14725 [Leptothrix sp. (in: Bacteria)]|nr:hypothetical protein [Leptothrix sp. (in: b-proteobacteria)]
MADHLTPTRRRRAIFWALLLAFVAWDLQRSPPIDLWREPPLIAAGSGQVSAGGHCSAAK